MNEVLTVFAVLILGPFSVFYAVKLGTYAFLRAHDKYRQDYPNHKENKQ